MKPRFLAVALAAALGILTLTAVIDAFARTAHRSDVRAEIAADADALARGLSDVVVRESSAVETLAAFAELAAGDEARIAEDFPFFADALMRQGATVRSVQLAPGSILRYVYPEFGSTEAIGLDLMADPGRRALLEPATHSGDTVIQGPVELAGAGVGLIVHRPVFRPDGGFWGFASVVLDWPAVAGLSRLESRGESRLAGVRLPETRDVIAGNPGAFEHDPVLRELQVGATDTTWELALRPIRGWPTSSPITPVIWIAGLVVASLSGVFAHGVAERPDVLRRERLRALADLALAEARYQATFLHAGVGIVVTDAHGRILSANPSFRQILGLSEAEPIVDRTVLEFVHPDDRDEQAHRVSELRRGASVVEGEVRVATAQDERWCKTRVTAIPGEEGERSLFVGIVEDTTVRRMAEAALTASELRFRQLFELAPIAIQREDHSDARRRLDELRAEGITNLREHLERDPRCLTDLLARVRITDANPAAQKLQQHLERGFGDLTLLDRYTEENAPTFIETLVAIWESRSGLELGVTSRAIDGSPMYLDVKWEAPVVDGQPDYANVMVTISDVTELRETERRLQDLLESKDRFLASVAHELRTPLTAVVGFAQELRESSDVYGPDERAEFEELIAFHSTEMSYLIEDLLVWARGDIGAVRISPENMDLGEAVRQTLLLLPNSELRVIQPDGMVQAYADSTRVRQIIRNLVTNAIRYGGDDVEVRIRGERDCATVEVSDDGPAIPEATRERIFEPYEHAASLTMPGSIGLGLTVSRSLARLQNGDLVLVREDERNVFRVTLPNHA